MKHGRGSALTLTPVKKSDIGWRRTTITDWKLTQGGEVARIGCGRARHAGGQLGDRRGTWAWLEASCQQRRLFLHLASSSPVRFTQALDFMLFFCVARKLLI